MTICDPAARMTAVDHLTELRGRLIWSIAAIAAGTAISFCFISDVIAFLTAPAGHLYFVKPAEVVVIYFKTAVLFGCFLASPVIFYEFWAFILPALTRRERTWACILVPVSVLSFAGGIAFSYAFVLPQSLHFLMNFGGDTFQPLLSMENYLDFVILMVFPFGFIFNMPLILVTLAGAGLVTGRSLAKARKYVIILSFLFAAVITPTPDILSQCLMAVPMIILYEASLLFIRFIMRK